MATEPAANTTTDGLVDRGRAIVATHTLDLSGGATPWPELASISAHVPDITHLEVVVLRGPHGQEVAVWPCAGARKLPGEFYVLVPGALGAPAAYDSSTSAEMTWVSPHSALTDYLRTHEFGASALPGGQRSAEGSIDLDWTVQVSALDADRSLFVCQLGTDTPAVITAATVVVDRLAGVTSQSRAAGRQGMMHPIRFAAVVELVASGKLDQPPVVEADPAPPAVEAHEPEPPVQAEPETETEPETKPKTEPAAGRPTLDAPAVDARAAVVEALQRYAGKRVSVGPLADKKKLANVLRGVAPGVDPDEICGFVDTGVRANGKAGAVFTPTAVHFTEGGVRHRFDYAEIQSFEFASSAVIVNGTDDRTAKISTADQTFAIAEAIAAASGLLV